MTGRYVVHDDGVGSDTTIVAESDGAEHLRTGADQNAIADCRVSLDRIELHATQSRRMKNNAIVADDSGLADDNTNSVVDD